MKHSQKVSKSDLEAVKIQLGTLLGNVSCMTTGKQAVEIFTMAVKGDFILPDLLQWVMIYSFGINTDSGNRSQFDP